MRNRLRSPDLAANAFNRLCERLLSLNLLRGLWADLRARIGKRYARAAENRGDHDETLRRWQAIIAQSPDDRSGYLNMATALRNLARWDDADAILVSGMQRLPAVPALASEYAVNADLRYDSAEAVRRWQAVRERFPNEPIGYAGLGAALKSLRRLDEAEAVFAEGLARFPDDDNLAINYAWLTVAREDWRRASHLWRELHRRLPEDRGVAAGLDRTLFHIRLADVDALAAAGEADPGSRIRGATIRVEPVVPLEPNAAHSDHRPLLMKFESCGENCELGFVQRYFGAEPLGLLRWSGIPYAKLIDGLASGFAGVGEAAGTVLVVDPVTREYMVSDRRFDMDMHTFLYEDKVQEEIIFQRLCRRLRYLRDKFIEDLTDGDKILVFQSGEQRSDQDLFDLHAALRRYGEGTLLCVRLQNARCSAGDVEVIGDGLLAGYLDRAGYDGQRWDISFDCWLTLCQKADRLSQRSSGVPAAARGT